MLDISAQRMQRIKSDLLIEFDTAGSQATPDGAHDVVLRGLIHVLEVAEHEQIGEQQPEDCGDVPPDAESGSSDAASTRHRLAIAADEIPGEASLHVGLRVSVECPP
ncbi:MAG: hypothetical protein V4801_10285 [Burkholderia gladioli]